MGAGHQRGEGWTRVGNRVGRWLVIGLGGHVISGERAGRGWVRVRPSAGRGLGGQVISGERLDGGGQVISYYPG